METEFEEIKIGKSKIIKADCFDWLKKAEPNSVHAVVTDPPYGLKEYEDDQIKKKDSGKGGVWRIPPSFDGSDRAPLPRFTALTATERTQLKAFFQEWTQLLLPVLRPGAHVFVASNSFLSNDVFSAIVAGGLEFRGEIIRLVKTLRGGDKPKNAEVEFPDVCSLPRGCYEPWGLFRKSLPSKMTVAACLREWGTGALKRLSTESPFVDVIESERTSAKEKLLATHPSLKPQSFMRQLVKASLPLEKGIVLDCFCGSGSTIAAAEHLGYASIGVERSEEYFRVANEAIPRLASFEFKA
jgi:site-specific DNA-methyltransferase (adenine-specific)